MFSPFYPARLGRLHKIAMANNLGPAMDVKCLFAIISAIFDSSFKVRSRYGGEIFSFHLKICIFLHVSIVYFVFQPRFPPLLVLLDLGSYEERHVDAPVGNDRTDSGFAATPSVSG